MPAAGQLPEPIVNTIPAWAVAAISSNTIEAARSDMCVESAAENAASRCLNAMT